MSQTQVFKTPDASGSLTCPLHGMQQRHVAILASSGCHGMVAAPIAEVFAMCTELAARSGIGIAWAVRFLSYHGGPVACRASLTLWTEPFHVEPPESYDAVFQLSDRTDGAIEAEKALMDVWLQRASVIPIPAAGPAARSDRLPMPEAPSAGHIDRALVAALAVIRRRVHPDIARTLAEAFSREMGCPLAALIGGDVSGAFNEARRASQWIRNNCERDITVLDVADAVGVSQRTLLRLFLTEFGKRPSDHMRDIRIELARALLLNTDLPVDTIAWRTGLRTGDRLAKVFRRFIGKSPTDVRQLGRMEDFILHAHRAPL
ncbi:helix-turn-helix domain-containing protein [Paraburkholderia azotifigens]|uniref:Helix-turn-helix domain-containing protein n=1 Tax=Paraburkholderia azotifigens TaxID=2057004 RepID=A0ABU9R2U9_9BURK